MQTVFGLLALAASVVNAFPQGVTQNISPPSPAPAGCQPDYSGPFQISVTNVSSSAKVKRQAKTLTITLSGGVLKDDQQRTGYIAANYQFQFDGPPQAGAIYTSGFSVCGNGTLALGGSAIFYQCYSGGFYNLYDRSWAAQCSPIYIEVIGGGSSSGGGAATQATDGQPAVTTQKVSQISDGQVQGTPNPVAQIGDGQVQNGPKVSQISDGQIQASPQPAVSQISDGQVQASPAAPKPAVVSQISDGQVQATPAAPKVSQISDGQVQASPAAPKVSQISDGQIQATPGPKVSQISDGQIQASPKPVVSQISDGQVQAPSTTSAAAPVQQTVNAAPVLNVEIPAAIAGIFAAVALL